MKNLKHQTADADNSAAALPDVAYLRSGTKIHPTGKADRLTWLTRQGQKLLRTLVPSVHQRGRTNARIGLSVEEQTRVCQTVDLGSPANPWTGDYVQRRNRLIVNLLLATGMRRGELLNLQIRDLDPRTHTIRILRRADDSQDPRRIQPNVKTYAREIKLMPAISRELLRYIDVERHAIKAARRYPQIFVSDAGAPLSLSSIDKIFKQLRAACPGLPVALTSHVMRHTWNERFSEIAEKMGLSEVEEQRARANQQGWSETSDTAAIYTRRYAERKGREAALRLQEKLEDIDEKPKTPDG